MEADYCNTNDFNYDSNFKDCSQKVGESRIFDESKEFSLDDVPVPSYNMKQSNVKKCLLNIKYLEKYRWETTKRVNSNGGCTTVFIWKYDNCNKEFTRSWSILDHVRMHEGIRPYECKYCPRAYTQKGNMIKHMKRHTDPDMFNRRHYTWEFCQRKYTEKYNLKVSPIFNMFWGP